MTPVDAFVPRVYRSECQLRDPVVFTCKFMYCISTISYVYVIIDVLDRGGPGSGVMTFQYLKVAEPT